MLSQDTEQRAALYEALSSYYAGNLPAGETFIRLTNAYLQSDLVLPPKEDDVGFDFNRLFVGPETLGAPVRIILPLPRSDDHDEANHVRPSGISSRRHRDCRQRTHPGRPSPLRGGFCRLPAPQSLAVAASRRPIQYRCALYCFPAGSPALLDLPPFGARRRTQHDAILPTGRQGCPVVFHF